MDCENLTLHTIVPFHLKDRDLSSSDIWYRELHFERGHHYHISAPSGSGKTTLARILYGLSTAYAGSYFIGDRHAKSLDAGEWSRLRQKAFAIVFQDLRLFDELSARQNIEIKNELQKSSSDAEIDEMLQKLGAAHTAARESRLLSQGEKQRVAIVRALCQPFTWLILDEPFSHLDAEAARAAARLIAEKAAARKAGVISLQLEDDDFFPYSKKWQL